MNSTRRAPWPFFHPRKKNSACRVESHGLTWSLWMRFCAGGAVVRRGRRPVLDRCRPLQPHVRPPARADVTAGVTAEHRWLCARSTSDLEYYTPSAVTTSGGNMIITATMTPDQGHPYTSVRPSKPSAVTRPLRRRFFRRLFSRKRRRQKVLLLFRECGSTKRISGCAKITNRGC